MKAGNKVLSWIMAIALVITMVPAMAYAEFVSVKIDEENFPDENFREYVRTLPGGKDGVFVATELDLIKKIDCDNGGKEKKIGSLVGIEHFTKLEQLICSNNEIGALDLRANKALSNLDCHNNQLTEVNVADILPLEIFDCSHNQLVQLDVSKNPQLDGLNCSYNQLSSLDVSQNGELWTFECSDNNIGGLDLKANGKLHKIDCDNNMIDQLDISGNPQVKFVSAMANYITDVDTSNNPNIEEIYYVPKTTVMSGGQPFDYTKVKTLDEFIVGPSINNEMVLENLTLDKVNKTMQLYPGENQGKIIFKNRKTGVVKTQHIFIGKPGKVTGLKARLCVYRGGYDDAYITWNKVDGADGYSIYLRRPGDNTKWYHVARTSKNSYIKKNMYDGKVYQIKVIPYSLIGGSMWYSDEPAHIVNVTTLKKGEITRIKRLGCKKVNVSWKNVLGKSGYQVMVKGNRKVNYYNTTKTTQNYYICKGLKYEFSVRAYQKVCKNGKLYKVYGPWSNKGVCILR